MGLFSKKGVKATEDSGEVMVSTRELTGRPATVFYCLCIAASVFHVLTNTVWLMPEIQRNALHFAFFVPLAFMIYPFNSKSLDKKPYLDWFLAALSVVCGLYLVFFEDALHARNEQMIGLDIFFAGLTLLLMLEIARRAAGKIIPLLAVFFLSYALYWGQFLSGNWNFPGVTTSRVLYRMYFAPDGIFGSIATISASYVFLFVLFGSFLVKSGAGDFIIKLAISIVGRSVGGPAKMAVFSSGLMGSVSGSAVANTVSTGSITIPMMKRTGFSPKFAAAVEAAASTGGQIMPPIMGAGAFVMAQWTQISYLKIVAISFIPAILYFVSVIFFVHSRARSEGLQPTAEEDIPRFFDVLKEGWPFFIPIGVLITLMSIGYTPTYAACCAIGAIVGASWMTKNHRMGLADIVDALALGGKNMVATAIILLCSGVVIGIVLLVSLGVKFSMLISTVAGSSLLVTIGLVGVASLILGMGLPVTASYIILATLSAPFLVNLIKLRYVQAVNPQFIESMGLSLDMISDPTTAGALFAIVNSQVPPEHATIFMLAAHLLIFWYSQSANVTPPVCLAAYTAAGIAKSDPFQTGIHAFKLASGLFIIPIMFVYEPAILFLGPLWQTILTVGIILLALFCTAVSLEGVYIRRLHPLLRLTFGCNAVLLYALPELQCWIGVGIFATLTVILKYTKMFDLDEQPDESALTEAA